jgi:hypothetical protein
MGAVAGTILMLLAGAASAQPASINWMKQLGTPGEDFANDVARDSSGNVMVGGSTAGNLFGTNLGASSSSSDAFIARYSSTGTLLWSTQFGNSRAGFDAISSVGTDPSGAIYGAGRTDGTLGASSAGGVDTFLRKYDAAGNALWTAQFGTSGDDSVQGMSFDSSGNVYVSGQQSGPNLNSNSFVAKYSPSGTQIWLRQIPSSTGSSPTAAVKVDASGNVIVTGSTGADLGGQTGGYDAFARKYDSNGNILWTRQWGSTQPDIAHGIAVDGSGNILVVGSTSGSIDGVTSNMFGDEYAFVTKLASDGTIDWTRQMKMGTEEFGYGIDVDAAGNAYFAGMADAGNTNDDLLIGSLDAQGHLRWSQTFPGINQGEDWFTGIMVDPSGNRAWLSGSTEFGFGQPTAGEDDALVAAVDLPEPAGLSLLASMLGATMLRRRRGLA